ncbi:MAG: DPP IV N-terminal domain-containing protein [Bacteroidia bacterium]|nr:DPP IV N-terminal domain-containing protein [Bacteroidia bacterium]
MCRIKSYFVVFLILSGITGFSQTKELTIEDVSTGSRQFTPKTLKQLQWRYDLPEFTWVRNDQLMQNNLKDTVTTYLLKVSDLNNVLKAEGMEELKAFPAVTWKSNNSFEFSTKDYCLSYNILTKKLRKILKFDENAENYLANVNGVYAYTVDNNLFISDSTGKVSQVTKDTDKGIVNGATVSRDEFGINGGIFWSPKGNYLAFYRKDETEVAEYPLVDITAPEATLKETRYPMTGSKSEHITVGVYDPVNHKTLFLETGGPDDQYLTCVTWSPDEKYIFIAHLNREQNHLKLNCYNASTGKFVNTLFEETSDKYVEPQDPLYFLKTRPDQFLWFSRRDGYRHPYLYDTSGKMIRQLTKGNWEVTDIIGTDSKEQNLFIRTTADSPLERQVYKVNLINGKIKKLTTQDGTHSAIPDKSGKYFADIYSSVKSPRIINLMDADGKLMRNLLTADNPFKDYKMGEMSISTIKAADDTTTLYCRMIRPPDFDASKKYPVIVYVYGGPHEQLIRDTWLGGASMFDWFMAQKGYIIFTVDNRGSANRGRDFENVIHRNLGVNEMADQMKGIKYLESLGYADMKRIGVSGWSFGGFMTTSLMTHYPDVFKVGVAGGAVTDWRYYEVMYGERYMDKPDENPDGYEKTSVISAAKNLKGKLLLIHGAMDKTVVWQNTLSFLRECIKQNVQVDYFVYPLAEHGVGARDRLHLNTKIMEYFDQNLK